MTQEDFIRMAREAGFIHGNQHSEIIVRHSSGAWVSIEERLHQFFIIVAAAEREACAQICDGYAEADHANYSDSCAAAIRARGINTLLIQRNEIRARGEK